MSLRFVQIQNICEPHNTNLASFSLSKANPSTSLPTLFLPRKEKFKATLRAAHALNVFEHFLFAYGSLYLHTVYFVRPIWKQANYDVWQPDD